MRDFHTIIIKGLKHGSYNLFSGSIHSSGSRKETYALVWHTAAPSANISCNRKQQKLENCLLPHSLIHYNIVDWVGNLIFSTILSPGNAIKENHWYVHLFSSFYLCFPLFIVWCIIWSAKYDRIEYRIEENRIEQNRTEQNRT